MNKEIFLLKSLINEIQTHELYNFFNSYNIQDQIFEPNISIYNIDKDLIFKVGFKFDNELKIYSFESFIKTIKNNFSNSYLKKILRIIINELTNHFYYNDYIEYLSEYSYKTNQYNIFSLLDYYLNNNEIFEIRIEANDFYGFYESIYYNSDLFIDEINEFEQEYNKLHSLIYENDIIEYDLNEYDYKRYKYNISHEYSNLLYDTIEYNLYDLFELNENEYYEFEFIKDKIKLFEPKYYNYDKDLIVFSVNTNHYTLKKLKEFVIYENKNEFLKYLKENNNYTTFELNENYNLFYNKPINHYSNIEINELIQSFILITNDKNIFHEINEQTYYNINIYDYTPRLTINEQKPYFYLYNKYMKYIKTNLNKYYHMLNNKHFNPNNTFESYNKKDVQTCK